MRVVFSAPPGWPVPPLGWLPDAAWRPDPSWPAPPPGWTFLLPEPEDALAAALRLQSGAAAAVGASLAGLGAAVVVAGHLTASDDQALGPGLGLLLLGAFASVAGAARALGARGVAARTVRRHHLVLVAAPPSPPPGG